jgi:LacI family transcriptional regulator
MLRRTHSELIGVIFPDVQNDFYSATMSTLAAAFLKQGYKLVLATSEDRAENELKHIQSLREARVAGVIIAPTAALKKKSIALLDSIPTVQLLRRHSRLATATVRLDEKASVAMAVNHLIAQGHTRIGFIGSDKSLSTGRDRAAGYTDAMRAGSLDIDDSLLLQGPPRPEFGRRALSRFLLHDRPPTAVVIASPELTLGGLAAIQEFRIQTPEDLALIGYHDPDWFRLWGPGISCVRLPVEDMAAAAARLLLQQLDSVEPGTGTGGGAIPAPLTPQDVLFQSSLIVRGTA